MVKFAAILAMLSLSLASSGAAGANAGALDGYPPAWPPPKLGERVQVPGGPARLTFSDEFSGDSLDPEVWNRWYPHTSSCPAKCVDQGYYAPDAFEQYYGVLMIRSDRRRHGDFKYSTGVITTRGSFAQAYGYFEVRAKLPRGVGLWPAFWMIPADQSWPPEIDVFEYLGKDSSYNMGFHWTEPGGEHRFKINTLWDRPYYTNAFKTYGVSWRPGELVWYVDGVEKSRQTGDLIPDMPMSMIINTAVGNYPWAGRPDASTVLPAYLAIDYVRAYQYEDVPPGAQGHRVLLAIPKVSPGTAKPGQSVDFEQALTVNSTLAKGAHVQVMLFAEDLKTRIARRDFRLDEASAGETYRVKGRLDLPRDLPPGHYRMSVGVFDGEWRQVAWLTVAYVLVVSN